MQKNNFLNKLKKQEKLALIEPTEEICESYTEKSANCLKAAKLLNRIELRSVFQFTVVIN